jgi:probable ribonuclease FAU-1
MAPSAKIRGIYTTALTRLLLDAGYRIGAPSPETRQRFALGSAPEIPDLLIKDREDHQGVDIIGEADGVSRVVKGVQEKLLDAVLLDFGPLGEREKDLVDELKAGQELCRARLELGGASKETLDRFRSSVIPTLALHHRLRIIHRRALEEAERQLLDRPTARRKLERNGFQEAVLIPLGKTGAVRLEHVKATGKPVRPREGILLKAVGNRILLKRVFSQGRYDGLDLPIEGGDYGLTEASEGAWQVKHSYFSKEGKLKGEYYNVNTPVELYPFGARYIDLEIDVVRRAGGRAFIVDREKLELLVKEGKISRSLEKKAVEVADHLMEKMGEQETQTPRREVKKKS